MWFYYNGLDKKSERRIIKIVLILITAPIWVTALLVIWGMIGS